MNILHAFRNLAVAAWRLAMLRLRYALWRRFGCAVLALLAALAAVPARAETCQTYKQGDDTVTQCGNGSETRSYKFGDDVLTEHNDGGRDDHRDDGE